MEFPFIAFLFYMLFTGGLLWSVHTALVGKANRHIAADRTQHRGVHLLAALALLAGFSAMPAGVLPALLYPPYGSVYLICCIAACMIAEIKTNKHPLQVFFFLQAPRLIALAGTCFYAFCNGLPGLPAWNMDAFVATPVWNLAEWPGRLGLLAAFAVCLISAPCPASSTSFSAFLWRCLYAHVIVCLFIPSPLPMPVSYRTALAVQLLFMWGKTLFVALVAIPFCQKRIRKAFPLDI